jgi:hypothetical protein
MSHFFPNQVMYEDVEQTSENENKVLKMAMCVFQLGSEPFSLLSMLPADVQVTVRNITAQNTIYNKLETITGRSH